MDEEKKENPIENNEMPQSTQPVEKVDTSETGKSESTVTESKKPETTEPEKKETGKKNPDDYWRPRDSKFAPGKASKENNEDGKGENKEGNGSRKEDNPFRIQFDANSNGDGPRKKGRIGILLLVVLLGFVLYTTFNSATKTPEVTYTSFKETVENGQVSKANIKNSTTIVFNTLDGGTYKTRIPYADTSLLSFLDKNNVEVKGSEAEVSFLTLLIEFLPWIIFIGFTIMIMRNASANGQMMQFGKSHAKEYNDKQIKIKFADVAGQKEAKYELEEVVEFLKDPKRYSEIGAKMPRGVLLVGPPGTGKTLLAKAVAGEAGVSFFHTSGSDFVEMFVGMGAARVRDLFDQGRKHSPCILFIDEIDAVGRARGSGLGGGHDEREQTLNQILVEMDGFDTTSGVIVIAATNRADVLDPALLRPGRFDRQVYISLPDIDEREAILKIHAAKVKTEDSVDLRKIARATSGASGADLANLVNEAALYATREKRKKVNMADFDKARDKMVLGVEKKSHVMTEEDKKMTAYHESGHALLYYYLPDVEPLYKVTIIPHGNAGGVTMGLPETDVNYYKTSTLTSDITITMGGYVAEKLLIGQTTTGPSSDIKQATDLARRMVTEWGMSSLGFISLGSEDEPLFLGREIAQHKDFSEETAKKVDKEVQSILDSCMKKATELLTGHRDQLDKLAAELLVKETLDDYQIRELLGFEKIEKKNTDLT